MLIDFFRYSFRANQPTDRREQLMQFLFKDYPAYLRQKPSL